jgi:hypothetical protein
MRGIVVAMLVVSAMAIAPAHAAPDMSFGGVSFSDAKHGWAVFTTRCGASGAVCARVQSTADGGRMWRPLARLRVCDGPADALCVATAHRVDAKRGFVLGLQTMMTSDGGRTWVRVRMPRVEALTAARGGVFALTSPHSGCPGPCDVVLRRAGVGDDRFAPVRAFPNPSQGHFDDIVGAGPNLYVVGFGNPAGGAGTAYARLSISRDGGRTWSSRGDPCRTPGGSEVDMWRLAAAGRYAAAICLERRAGARWIMVSRDAGRTFTRLQPPAPEADEIVMGPDGAIGVTRSFASGSSGGLSHFRVALSRDLGRTWRAVLRSDDYLGSPSYPGLQIFGRSLRAATGQQMWRSEDAGATWEETSVATLGS